MNSTHASSPSPASVFAPQGVDSPREEGASRSAPERSGPRRRRWRRRPIVVVEAVVLTLLVLAVFATGLLMTG